VNLVVRPVPVAPAKAHVLRTHRRLPRVAGAMWGIGCYDGPDLVGVAVVGRPNARVWQQPGRLQVLRLAVEEGRPNACSMLYGACARAARAMGTIDLWTYTHEDEPGTSLRAAGWIRDDRSTRGGEHGRQLRPRETLDARPKWRWWAPWSAELAQCDRWRRSA
jgi:hypothetical protein